MYVLLIDKNNKINSARNSRAIVVIRSLIQAKLQTRCIQSTALNIYKACPHRRCYNVEQCDFVACYKVACRCGRTLTNVIISLRHIHMHVVFEIAYLNDKDKTGDGCYSNGVVVQPMRDRLLATLNSTSLLIYLFIYSFIYLFIYLYKT